MVFQLNKPKQKEWLIFFGNVFAVVINLILGSLETVWGNLLGIKWLSADGNCRLGNLSGTVIKDYSKECGDDSSGGGWYSRLSHPPKSNSHSDYERRRNLHNGFYFELQRYRCV